MLYKKRWSDGLQDDFEHLDEFQFKFGLFGGDGGGGGGGGTSKAEQDAKAAAQEPSRGMSMPDVGFRGEQSAAAQGVRDAALGRAREDAADRVQGLVSKAVFDSGFYDSNVPAERTVPGLAEMYPDAVVAPTRPSALDNISLTTPETPAFNMPTISDLMNMTETISANVPANVPTNVPASNLGLNQFQFGPGTLTVNPEVSGKGLTGAAIDYSVPIGPVSSLQPTGNPMVDAMISGMQNAAANPAQPSTQLASSDTFNVFGTLTSPLEFVGKNLAKKGNTYTPASSGGITSTRRQPSMYDKVTRTGKSLADQIGIGSLFGN